MSEQIHKRRKRYKGTHPRNFEEKYKELDPEIPGYHSACNAKREYPGRHAYFYYGR